MIDFKRKYMEFLPNVQIFLRFGKNFFCNVAVFEFVNY